MELFYISIIIRVQNSQLCSKKYLQIDHWTFFNNLSFFLFSMEWKIHFTLFKKNIFHFIYVVVELKCLFFKNLHNYVRFFCILHCIGIGPSFNTIYFNIIQSNQIKCLPAILNHKLNLNKCNCVSGVREQKKVLSIFAEKNPSFQFKSMMISNHKTSTCK